MIFIVIVEYMEPEIHSFNTYEEAKEFAAKQKGYNCEICKIIAYKSEFKNTIEEIK